ncbi:MAG: DEAD/DEAH box helicase [Chlamydiales bacterium]|nr:DEAD/DEAH box helicase [Chlamydiales bacterium]
MTLVVKEMEFSSQGAYQLLVSDTSLQKEYWIVLQFNDEDMLVDAICECSDQEDACVHILAAKKHVYNRSFHPLHVRFRNSLWNILCKNVALRIGTSSDNIIRVKPSAYECLSLTGKPLFSISALLPESKDWLEKNIHERVKETEKSSLKFSRISDEELLLWKEGRPAFKLAYELSFWCDLAKHLFLLQEGHANYAIQFVYSKHEVPKGIEAAFDAFLLFFYVAFTDLETCIPALLTVSSPLKVCASSYEKIDKILYDQENVRLVIERDLTDTYSVEFDKKDVVKSIPIGEWQYIPRQGFFMDEKDPVFSKNYVERDDIEDVLNKHIILIEKHLQGFNLYKDEIRPSYYIFFDGLDALHIQAYLKETGDLQRVNSQLFGSWIYLEDDGFYKVQDRKYLSLIIPKKYVGDFVSENKVWLDSKEGFQTHLTSVRANLNYILDESDVLRFFSEHDLENEKEEIKDFDKWIYIENKGFYAKHQEGLCFFIQNGMSIASKDISFFIHVHEDELEMVPGFFSSSSPIQTVQLKITLEKNLSIKITPSYLFATGYKLSDLKFFEDFVFVRGEGFSRTSLSIRLPFAYQQEKIIPKNERDFFLSTELEGLMPYIAFLDPRLQKPKELKLELHEFRKQDEGEFLIHFVYKTERGAVHCNDIWKALKRNERFLFTDVGLIDLQDMRFEWLLQFEKYQIQEACDLLCLSAFHVLKLQLFEEVRELFEEKSQHILWQEILHFQSSVPLDISSLKSTLRAYQEMGVKWLWFLYTQKLSGLLCDDMGLGKTHQAMALIAAISSHTGNRAKFLVACPTSVIFHWQEKLKMFLPHLRIFTLYGQNRDISLFEKDYDLLLTSYGILRVELKQLVKISFELTVFDEVQIAKNHQSLTHKALLALKAKMKLGLTGTPIENRLRELKSLFDLVMPSYMPSEDLFRELFVIPIEKLHETKPREQLNRFVKPFVLRRKKTDVLLELPEKTEEEAFAELLEDQERLYEQMLIQAKQTLSSELENDAKPIPYLSLFALLGKLKQICDHPAVFLKDPSRYKEFESGKWNLFVELLQEALDSEQKVVVFSHYLGMLDIMQTYFNEVGISFASIRGSTRNREEELRRFHEDPKCMVFLGSLQAVGLGVELTAASVVIHYDRWWNAARENQATDRVYRMGQKRGVQVFKLITKGTIEEHIAMLIQKKAGLMEDVIGTDDEALLKQLTREEWLSLFSITQS